MKFRFLLLPLLALIAVPAHAEVDNVIHHERSLYRDIYVTQEGDLRCMVFYFKQSVGHETCKYMSRPQVHAFDYTKMMMAGLFLNPRPKRILIIGLGGGTMSDTLEALVPGAVIDNVELDPAVGTIAKKYFGFGTNKRVNLSISDGRVFVKRRMRSNVRYDMVMMDAFDGDYIPEHMLTQDFFKEVKQIMTPNGVFVANGYATGRLYPHESETYRSVFGRFYNMKDGNRVVVAKLGKQLTAAELKRNAALFSKGLSRIGTSSSELLGMMSTRVDWNTEARILTDQYSPANILNRR